MRRRASFPIALGVALLGALGGCSPAAPPPAPRKPAPVAVAPPARVGTMICRSSVDGRSVKCGTPNAVMVGMKFD